VNLGGLLNRRAIFRSLNTKIVRELPATGDAAVRWPSCGTPRTPSASSMPTPTRSAAAWIDELIQSTADHTLPPEVRSLGRTLSRWHDQITGWGNAFSQRIPGVDATSGSW